MGQAGEWPSDLSRYENKQVKEFVGSQASRHWAGTCVNAGLGWNHNEVSVLVHTRLISCLSDMSGCYWPFSCGRLAHSLKALWLWCGAMDFEWCVGEVRLPPPWNESDFYLVDPQVNIPPAIQWSRTTERGYNETQRRTELGLQFAGQCRIWIWIIAVYCGNTRRRGLLENEGLLRNEKRK